MVLEKFDLSGKAIAITGAGRGLGEQMAYALAHAGADLVLASRTEKQLDAVAERVRSIGRKARVVPTDVRDSVQCDRLVQVCVDEYGKIDVMLSNAGIGDRAGAGSSVMDLSDDDWHDTIDVNLSSAFYCARAAARFMSEANSGVIINVSSGTALRGFPQSFAYGAAKAGVIALTKSLAVALARYGVRANAIVPGFVAQIPPLNEQDEEQRRARGRFIPAQRLGEATELGPLAVFLASEASSYITGNIYIIDGGGLADGLAPVGFAPAEVR
jgi:NAD(P)-dependent dehydrogenase (short-subunit alcohol dehydrogenase family)